MLHCQADAEHAVPTAPAPLLRLATALLVAALTAACGSDTVECRTGAECASGVCRSDGTCAPLANDVSASSDLGDSGGTGTDGTDEPDGVTSDTAQDDTVDEADTGTTDAGVTDTGLPDSGMGDSGADDAGPNDSGNDDTGTDGDDADTSFPDADPPVICKPNHDGVITIDEAPMGAELAAPFRVASDVTVDMKGDVVDGDRVWDLASDLDGDQDVTVTTHAPDGYWFEEDFPDATYVSRLSQTAEQLGVFQITDDALLLLGIASPESGFFQTLVTYDPPVAVLEFPLIADAQWSTDSTATGQVDGVFAWVPEEYESLVDAAGILQTPFGNFPVMRIRTVLTRQVGAVFVTVRTFTFVAECFGTIATVVSQDFEDEVEFSEAAEVRRLTVP